MNKLTELYIKEAYNIQDKVFQLHNSTMTDIADKFHYIDDIREFNQYKVLKAFQEEKLSDAHFTNSTGYGYDDIGRDTLDKVYARIFRAESAIVRPHFVNGTHAIGAALFGNLRPGDTMLSICGTPYDTLHKVIGLNKSNDDMGSLKDYGIKYKQIDLLQDSSFDELSILEEIAKDDTIKIVHIQRSAGYAWRKCILIESIQAIIPKIKKINNNAIIFIDNCYGEFIDYKEPTEVGADLMAGSLIKNIGGGISPSGGYIVGRKDLVDKASYRMSIPGIGGECGATFGLMRTMFQGLFLAPHIATEALKGAVYAARIMELAGFEVLPNYSEKRSDIIQAVKFNNEELLIQFCKGIQAGSPIDSFVECEPWDMPGYEDKVIMAAGAFIQGSSIELSADAPIKEPYIGYIQGGLTFDHVKIGIMIALSKMFIKNRI
ncbi:methionine gamma-lyase family protein [Clostridium sp. DL1XJH146]